MVAGADSPLPRRTRALHSWYRIPSALRTLTISIVWFGYADLLTLLNSADDSIRTMAVIWGACGAACTVTVIADLIRPRAFGSVPELVRYSAALQTGTPPDELDTALWLRGIRRDRRHTVVTWAIAVVLGGFGFLSADSSPSPLRWPLIAVYTLASATAFVEINVHRTRRERLASAISSRRAVEVRAGQVGAQPLARDSQQRQLHETAQLPLAARFATTFAATAVLALLILLVAELDALVYESTLATHVGNAALMSFIVALAITATMFTDPRVSARTQNIERILQYEWSFRGGQLPVEFDAEEWHQWVRRHRTASGALLLSASFLLGVATWSLSQPGGFHWVVAGLLGSAGSWQVLRWFGLRTRLVRFEERIRSHAVRRLFG